MKITDKRSSSGIIVARGAQDVQRVLKAGAAAEQALAAGMSGPAATDVAMLRQGVSQRLRKEGGSGGNVSMSLQRSRDPQHYWQANNDFYDVDTEDGLNKLRDLCRKLYASHPMIGSAVDIYSKWPLVGATLTCKDEKLEEFYGDLFFDTLNYEDYLVDIGREYWSVGEALPMGTWSESLGVWEHDELLNPKDVRVHKSPFLKDPTLEIRLPDDLRTVLTTQQPAHEYKLLMDNYPELAKFAYDDTWMPVSGHLLKQLRFKGDTFNPRGIPIMSRGIRGVLQEEMLNSAQDSISDRLSTPMILARIGATAQELGTQNPWVPSLEQIEEFEGLFDSALAADFRVLTTHFAVKIDSVFGRETMPNFDRDFERLTERILQVFGLSKTMLSGGSSGQTYAADALNRDLITQLLNVYQRTIRRFMRERMLIVAEAQHHFDYEERGGKRYPIMEEVLEVDPESGQKRIVEQPKLLVPDLHLKAMTMSDEEKEGQFLEALRASGVPISMRTRMANKPVDFDDEIESTREEQIRLAVENQKTRKETYLALKAEGLPIPQDLRDDFDPKAEVMGDDQPPAPAAQEQQIPTLGSDPQINQALAPVAGGDPAQQDQQAPLPGADGGDNVLRLPENRMMGPEIEGRTRPQESDEQRATMPKPASVAVAVRAEDADQQETVEFVGGMVGGPQHVGMRRYLTIDKGEPLEDQTG